MFNPNGIHIPSLVFKGGAYVRGLRGRFTTLFSGLIYMTGASMLFSRHCAYLETYNSYLECERLNET